MKRSYLLTAALLIFVAAKAAADPYADGQKLADAVYNRPIGKDVFAAGVMILQDAGKAPQTRQMYSFGKDKGGGNRLNLIRFESPPDISGVGMLTISHPGGATDQWLYLPALGKVRRIPSDLKGGRFVGSDLYNEDLRNREPNMDRHKVTGTEKYKGQDVTILESTPVDPDNSCYSKKISWISNQILVPLRVDFYQHDKLIKRAEALRIQKIQGIWTVMDMLVTDLDNKHTTEVKTEKVTYDSGLPDDLFSQQVLEDPQRDKSFIKQ